MPISPPRLPPRSAGVKAATSDKQDPPIQPRAPSPDWLMAQPDPTELVWLSGDVHRPQPHGLSLSFGFSHRLPVSTPQMTAAAPPSYAIAPPQSSSQARKSTHAPARPATPPYPAGSGDSPTTRLVGMMSRDVLEAAQQMEAQNYSYVGAVSKTPFQTEVQFERNAHTFQVLMGPNEASWTDKTTQMAQAGWTYFGRRAEGAFNQVLIYLR